MPLTDGKPDRESNGSNRPPESAGKVLMIGVAETGRRLSISVATVWRWNSAGLLPRPIKKSGTVRWRADELERWVEAGCPDRRHWEALTLEKAPGNGGHR
jgi:predicted DNA-binding transcriptional regulator AlpA